MSDLISRESAIYICECAIDLWQGQIGSGALIAVRDKIKELPSAQPEPCDNAEYYRGKIDGIKECTARLRLLTAEFKNREMEEGEQDALD